MSYYIYKICCDDLPFFVYVGSTKCFRQRKNKHKSSCNNDNSEKHNFKLYQTIRENGGWDNWRMVIIDECGEMSLTQVRIKEEEHRVKLNANLNTHRCHTSEEYKKEQMKEWCENNIDHKKEYDKEWRENNKEHLREYYENNKDRIQEYGKEYYENNKEKLKEKINCECGGKYTHKHKAQHFKTNKHLKYIESLEKD
jgi:hypothetical protein